MPPEEPQLPPAHWKVSLALLACIMTATATLNVVLQDLGWWFIALLACGIVLGTSALVRVWATWRWVPPVVAVLALFGFLTQQFAPQTTFIGLFPTFDTIEQFGLLIELAQTSIMEQTVPAEPVPGILFLIAGGIGLISLAADLVAISLQRRAWVGLLMLVVLWMPVLTVERDFDLFWVMAAAIAYLYLLRANAPAPDRRFTLSVAAGALAVALVAQVVLPTTEPVQAGPAGTAITTGDSPIVNLGNNLRRDVERRALTYSTESGSGQYLRLVSLDQFDGDKWFVGETPFEEENTPDDFGLPPGLSGEVERTTDSTRVEIVGLDTIWLPLPYPTERVVGLDRGWSWDPASLSLRTRFGSSRNQEYRVESLVLTPTPEQLLEAGSTVPRSVADLAVIQQDDVPPIIEETARAVVGDADSIYEKALALQQFLRAGDFSYSEDAPVEEGYDGTGLEVIATFLEVKSGYCVHFASAMALMARSLGIPARVAVGFLPGGKLDQRLEGRAVYEATSHDLHSWPELYFDGIGWMPFEPTATRGVIPDYADTTVAGVPIPAAGAGDPEPAPSDPAAADDPLARDAGDNSGSGAAAGTIPAGLLWLIGLSLLGVLLIFTPAMIRAIERRARIRTIRRGFAPATLGWHEVLQSAEDAGIPVPRSATPRESGRLLAEAIASGRRPAKDPDGVISSATAALARIVTMIELEGYARPGRGVSVSADDVAVTVNRLRSAQDWWARVRAVLLPASLWRRAVQAVRPRETA
ncbi:transglutaminase family protein [Homoserinimonas sp. A520]